MHASYIGNKWKSEIVRHLPSHKEIERKGILKRPLIPPVFSDLTSLTSHLYAKSSPGIKEMAKNKETIIWPEIWKQTTKTNIILSKY